MKKRVSGLSKAKKKLALLAFIIGYNQAALGQAAGTFPPKTKDVQNYQYEQGNAENFFNLEKPDSFMSYVYVLETPFYDLKGGDGMPEISKSIGIKEINWEEGDPVKNFPRFSFFSEEKTTIGILKGAAGASGGSGQTAYFFDTRTSQKVKVHMQNLQKPKWILDNGVPIGLKSERWDYLGPRVTSFGYAPRTDRIYVIDQGKESLVRSIEKEEVFFNAKFSSIEFSKEDLVELSKPFFDIDRDVGEKLMDFIYYSVRTNNSERVKKLLIGINPSETLKEEIERRLRVIQDDMVFGQPNRS